MPFKSNEKKQSYQRHYRENYKKTKRRIGVTVTIDEYTLIQKLAGDLRSVPAQLKAMAFAYHTQEYLVPPDIKKKLDEFVYHLLKIGNNINQLVREVHTARKSRWKFGRELSVGKMTRYVEGILTKLHAIEQFINETLTKPPRR